MSRSGVLRVEQLDPHRVADLYALRDAMVLDRAAAVRAAAILRLDASAASRLVVYLRDATRDPSAIVREAAFTGLARARDPLSLERAAETCAIDRGFRVRRMALLYAARTFGAAARSVLELGATDPFWRVRIVAHRAAASVLLSLGPQYADDPPKLTGNPTIDDDDPAVVTSRLLRAEAQAAPHVLTGLLANPHQPLRRIAIKQLAARAEEGVLRSVAAYLADERVPYAPAAAEATLARSAGAAERLAAELASARTELPAGVLAWAIAHAVPSPSWPVLEDRSRHVDARVRRAAVARMPEVCPSRDVLVESMAARLHDGDDETRARAASWLAASRVRQARELLLRLDPEGQPTSVRTLLARLAASSSDAGLLRRLSIDPHGFVRASALGALAEQNLLEHRHQTELIADPDPWVRAAVMAKEHAAAAMHDSAPMVRHAAFQHLKGTPQLATWAASATPDEPDPELRALAVRELDQVSEPSATRALLACSRDRDPGVRSAALESLQDRLGSVAALLSDGTLEPGERIAAHTILRVAGQEAPRLDPDPDVQAHIELLGAAAGGLPPAVQPDPPRTSSSPPEARQLGRTGILVNPFGVSGARGLRYDDFALAQDRGVNLFFWEPSHKELTRFLRSPRGERAIVVAGTYHADRESIERDLRRTLNALNRPRIDVFLAFWTRSSARLDEVVPVLGTLSAAGLVRAGGISTHDRGLARAAADHELDVVMVRHNAAHRGAETEVFPHCLARGTGVLTFSNLCYGRMLHRTPAELSSAPSAADCYRYSISQPGVVACISAPRRRSELVENLEVVDRSTVSAERQRELQRHGAHVYERSKAWNAAVRGERPIPAKEALDDWIECPDSISPAL